jgi:hypothetical protein
MLNFDICFCEKGIMSQCKATNWDQQKVCKFYVKHSFNSQCTNLDKQLNDHCWSPQAQAFGYHPYGIEQEDKEIEEEINLFEIAELAASTPGRDCSDCTRYVCSYLANEIRRHGAIERVDIRAIADNCQVYETEEMALQASINQSLRGTNP